VLLLTAYGTIQDAVAAVKAGAQDYLTKPVAQPDLLKAVEKALEVGGLRRENRRLREELAAARPLESILGESPPVSALREALAKAGPTGATVLLLGESGTGKELAARALHALSPRAPGPFVALNCAAVPPELLESQLFGHTRGAFTGAVGDRPGTFRLASGGTLFLDEIGDMAPPLQAKILRALQERVVDPVGGSAPVPVDVRVVAATHADLAQRVREGAFREDLHYRLAVVALRVPPLRERGGDLRLLFDHFYARFAGEAPEVSHEAEEALRRYPWPGNVRQLVNLCQRLAVLHPRQRVTPDLLPAELTALEAPTDGCPGAAAPGLWEVERAAIAEALERAGGNKSAAARALRIPRHVLLYRLKKFGIDAPGE
jgi:two-component system NtrC family response regulator